MLADWSEVFLEALAKLPNVSEAARLAGIDRRTAYNARESDPEFAKAWDDSLATSTDDLVGECYRRAKQSSDTLAIFLLKSHRPEVYRESIKQEITGPNGKAVQVQIYIPANGRDPEPVA